MLDTTDEGEAMARSRQELVVFVLRSALVQTVGNLVVGAMRAARSMLWSLKPGHRGRVRYLLTPAPVTNMTNKL